MSTLTHAAPVPVRTRPSDLVAAASAYMTAAAAADEVRSMLTRRQSAGVDPLPLGVEFLLEEAEARWDALARLARIDRHRAEPVTPMFADWRKSVTSVDWSHGRAA